MYYGCLDSCGGCNASAALPPGVLAPDVVIAPGVSMPPVLFGTAGLGERTNELTRAALAAGFRGVDSAQAREWYREDLVGAAIAASGADRERLFLVSKVHPRNLGYWNTLAMGQQSLVDLKTRSVDLLLLHYPECVADLCGGIDPEGSAADSWAALQELQAEGVARAIGVANFDVEQLADLIEKTKRPPAVAFAPSDPTAPNQPLVAFCERNGIVFVATSPLGPTATAHPGAHIADLQPQVKTVAARRNVTPAAAALRWALARGKAVVASGPEGLEALTAPLEESDLLLIDTIADKSDPNA